ncbi:MAG TPA: acetate kinase, partial [Terrimesophilobacter sp.]|nr:acetate kinase [Terrimesophilobacter sp.]
MTAVFVVNSGSSSIKYDLFDASTLESIASGLLERIGEPGGDAADHTAGMRAVLANLPD